jgi:glutamate formiminotransferase
VIVECVVNVSEGRDGPVLAELAAAAGVPLLHVHRDADHNRSVFTLAGPAPQVAEAVRALARLAVERLDISTHQGVHPRLGVLDVVPFVPYAPGHPPPQDVAGTVQLRDDFAAWLAATLDVPAFLYGPLPGGRTRSLPDIRRHAFGDLAPDHGPAHPHQSAGASAIGARPALVAYNVWVDRADLAGQVAAQIRGPSVRALGFDLGDRAQVSCNLIAPSLVGPAQVYDAVATRVENAGGAVLGAELVGLLPETVLHAITPDRWSELGLSPEETVEARLEDAGLLTT